MDQKWFVRALKAFFITATLLSSVGYANERFPEQLQLEKIHLQRCSEAELNAFRFIHVGNAAVYLEDCAQLPGIFSNTPKQLRFLYDQDIPANAFQEASVEYLKANLGEKFIQWKHVFEAFNQHYVDIKAGDYYDLIYHPEKGLLMQLNGRDLATIPARDIALAYLNVWFGRKPFSEELKNKLLKLNGLD